MIGTDNKIEVPVAAQIFREKIREMGLKAELNTEKQSDLSFILVLHEKELFMIGGIIQFECAGVHIGIFVIWEEGIVMVGEAYILKSPVQSGADLRLHGRFAVP